MQKRCFRTGLARVIVPAFSVLLIHQVAMASGPLRYRPKQDTTIAYEVEITAPIASTIETYKGTISYEVAAADQLLKLKFSGGLGKSTKRKPGASPDRGMFGPPAFPPMGRMGPFGGPRMPSGVGMQRTNLLTLTPRGEIRTLQGESQLPFVIGNLSLLPFEPLPEKNQKTWTVSSGVSLSEGGSSSHFRMHPFLDRGQEKITAANETTSFALESNKGDLSTFRKTYQLHSPGDAESVNINGNGRWTFNRRLGLSESLDCTWNLSVKEENVSVDIPVTIKYRRLSDEQLAQFEKERKEKEERSREEAKRREAERKKPLEEGDRRQILEDLGSGERSKIRRALHKILRKENIEDEDLARAVKKLVDSSDTGTRIPAEMAMDKFSSKSKAAASRPSDSPPARSELPRPDAGGGGQQRPDVASARGYRVWTDDSGTFAVMAKFLGFEGDNVRLKRKQDDEVIKVPLARLSEKDRQVAESLRNATTNPFD
ncbi:MAG: hypothetical protein JW888_05850 [Pirellulales bacterium]|nr:hypothetical protein [Pirellulales bacterium]